MLVKPLDGAVAIALTIARLLPYILAIVKAAIRACLFSLVILDSFLIQIAGRRWYGMAA